MDELEVPGKGRRPHQAVTGRPDSLCPAPRPRPGTPPPPEPWSGSAPPGGPVGRPRVPAAAQHTAPALFRPLARSGAGDGAQGVRAHPAKGSYLSASIRPTKRGLPLGLRGRGGSHGRGSRLPPPRAPRPYGGPERGRRDQGTGAAPAGGGGSCGAPWGGAGASARPRPEGTWERLSSRTKEAGEGSEPPGPGPELELVLDTSSGRWRGNPTELGRGLIRSPHVPGRERGRAPWARGGTLASPGVPGPGAPQSALDPRAQGSSRPLGESGRGRGLCVSGREVWAGALRPQPPHSHPTLGPGRSRGCAGLAGFSARRVGGRYSAAN